MSHKSVEAVIGKLATDEGFRRRFLGNALAALDELKQQGIELTPVEIQALAALDPEAVSAFAGNIDGRLQKVDCTPNGD
jgi:Ribosomally synthesized peptide prototyped by Frankia Franean1_4349.